MACWIEERMTPIRLKPADAERYIKLRRHMLEDSPWAFTGSPDDDQALDADFLRSTLARPDNAIMALVDAGPTNALIAVAGIYRAGHAKFAHRAKLWGVFVDDAHRGQGLGRAVTTAALDLARTWKGVDYIDVAVSANAPAALRLYQDLGFTQWGREPETTQVDGQRYDEIYLSLRLRAEDRR